MTRILAALASLFVTAVLTAVVAIPAIPDRTIAMANAKPQIAQVASNARLASQQATLRVAQ